MALKEIVLQQVRCGKQRDLPDALEYGQVGFSTDVGRVFVGLPSSTEPASIVAGRTWDTDPNSGKENVEIITEFTPWSVVNSLVNRPQSFKVSASTSDTVKIQSTSRLFIEYIAYSTVSGSTFLESGTVQLVVVGTNVLISQTNNTNDTDGIVKLEFTTPSYDSSSKQMIVAVTNSHTEEVTIEFVLRGWDA